MTGPLGITLRHLAARPAFTIASIATLAVGVAATTAVFSTVNATLLRPLPYRAPDQIFALNTRLADGRFTTGMDRVAGVQIAEINRSAPSVDHAVALIVSEGTVMPDEAPPRDILMAGVSEGFFDLFGVPMQAGRAFAADDHGTGAPPSAGGPPTVVAIISHRLWSELYGRDPQIVDRTIRLRGRNVTVVGVAPPGFDAPPGAEMWTPMPLPATSIAHSYTGYLRVTPGTSRERLDSELETVMTRVVETNPIATGRIFVATPLVESVVGDLGAILLVVLAGAVVLLGLACVNVATLILARGATQMKEMAVRVAIGATRGDILRVFLLEAIALATAGLLIGVAAAYGGVRLLIAYGGSELPRLDTIPFDGRVWLFAAGALVVSTLLVGVVPALRLSESALQTALVESGRGAGGGRWTRGLLGGLIVSEIALAITLVTGAGWLARSYVNLTRRDLGFTADGRLLVETRLPEDQSKLRLWTEQAPSWLEGINEVTAVGSASSLPLRPFYEAGFYVSAPGQPYDPNRQDVGIRSTVSLDFFEAMGVRLVAGRTFSDEDRPPPPVVRRNPDTGRNEIVPPTEPPRAIVNRAFAQRYFPGKDPVGATFAWGFPLVNFQSQFQVIGVVENIQYRSLREPFHARWYTPAPFSPRRFVIATTAADPRPLIPAIERALHQADASVSVRIEPFEQLVSGAMWRHQLGLVLMLVFAAASLALAAIGIFGVIADATGQRTRELATRMALGATPAAIVRLLLAQGRALTSAGVVLGTFVAYAAGRLAVSRLYEVRAGDPMILAAAILAVLAVTFVAFLVPALRATRITPAAALKLEQ
jgi:putative ABC transport system permease protein